MNVKEPLSSTEVHDLIINGVNVNLEYYMLPLFLLSSIVYQFLHAIQMLFIQLVGAYENGTDEGLNQSVNLGLNNSCNDYCEMSTKNSENSINQWLHKSGILDLYKSRTHCMDMILLLQPETQVIIPVKHH